MATRFGLTGAKPVYTPLDAKVVLKKAINKSELHPDNELYRSIIGSIMYAAQLCRPDVMHAVCRLSRYLNEPTNIHMTQAKRVLTQQNQPRGDLPWSDFGDLARLTRCFSRSERRVVAAGSRVQPQANRDATGRVAKDTHGRDHNGAGSCMRAS